MARVVTFGEIMLRLSPPGFERLFQSPLLGATFGGGEANVAVSLAHFGLESHFVTRLPAHAIGDAAVRSLRAEGVRTDFVQRGGNRVGIYFAEAGASQRASTVIYDRAHSSIAEMQPGTVDWARVFDGAAWFHVTGITPALGAGAAACTREAIAAAKAAGARVSVDLNYRKKLWTEAEAQAAMRPLMTSVDLVVANEEDLQSVLGLHVPDTDVTTGQLNLAGYRAVAEALTRDLGPTMVAITLRESLSASDNGWSAALWDAGSGSLPSQPALHRPPGGPDWRRRQLRRRPDLRAPRRPRARGGPALRGRGERAQADDPRRLQQGVGGRSGRAGEGGRVGESARDSRG